MTIELVEYLDPPQPGDTEDAWADYQYAAVERDLIEALAELGQFNLGNAWTLLTRAHRYARIAAKNRLEAARLRVIEIVTEPEDAPCDPDPN